MRVQKFEILSALAWSGWQEELRIHIRKRADRARERNRFGLRKSQGDSKFRRSRRTRHEVLPLLLGRRGWGEEAAFCSRSSVAGAVSTRLFRVLRYLVFKKTNVPLRLPRLARGRLRRGMGVGRILKTVPNSSSSVTGAELEPEGTVFSKYFMVTVCDCEANPATGRGSRPGRRHPIHPPQPLPGAGFRHPRPRR